MPISWVIGEGHRFDCGPFTRGGIEAKKALESSRVKKIRLVDLTVGGIAGMYHVGMDKLRWVEGEEHGIPLLRSADVLRTDLANQPHISRAQVSANPLFRCPEGSTLITRSGTIGRMAYCRADMARMAISQDVLKVVPDTDKIDSGYLYAFLSSGYGVPLVVSGTFGSIIVHIEAENIADLPVPRLGKSIEQRAHELVTRAANARCEAAELLAKADTLFIEILSLPKPKQKSEYGSPYIASASSSQFIRRGDGYYYAPLSMDARRAFDSAKATTTLGEVARVFIPGIFKRKYASDPAYGVPYITGADVFQLAPTSDQFLLKRIANDVGLILHNGMIVTQEAGQLGGLLGHSVLVGDYLDGFACSNNMIRVTASNGDDTGYLFAVLASTYGVRLVSRESAGSSIPHIEAGRVRAISIPWPEVAVRARIGKLVMDAQRLRDEAVSAEHEARALVEGAIEKGAN